MKFAPDANDTLQNDGPEAVRHRSDRARKYNGPGITINDFHAHMPSHRYIYEPTRELWPAASVNAMIGPVPLLNQNGRQVTKAGKPLTIPANMWLDRNRHVEQISWVPGLPTLIKERIISDGGWIERFDNTVFNLYRSPVLEYGDASKAGRWVDHVLKVFDTHTDHIICWLAHRVQKPQEKINHALFLGGGHGIGKDSVLEPVKHAVGPWNFAEVSPQQLIGPYNGFLKSIVLRLSEARDLGEVNRYAFYNHTKALMAAPPDMLRIDEKYIDQYYVPNVTAIVITSNHKTDGIYLPAEDRRHYVAWSDLAKESFPDGYWNGLWGWYQHGGIGHVAAYLNSVDLSGFDPKAPPPKTDAFWTIVDAGQAPEDAEMADVLDRLGRPPTITLKQIIAAATGSFLVWLSDRRNRRAIPHRLEQCDYVAVRNGSNKQGLWIVNNERQMIYGRKDLTAQQRLDAAQNL